MTKPLAGFRGLASVIAGSRRRRSTRGGRARWSATREATVAAARRRWRRRRGGLVSARRPQSTGCEPDERVYRGGRAKRRCDPPHPSAPGHRSSMSGLVKPPPLFIEIRANVCLHNDEIDGHRMVARRSRSSVRVFRPRDDERTPVTGVRAPAADARPMSASAQIGPMRTMAIIARSEFGGEKLGWPMSRARRRGGTGSAQAVAR
jgi:hypothetical protein